jgi:starvation-inducible DNA-binding protein
MPDNAELEGRIERLIEDYERAARRVAQVVELAENNKDIKTSDLLTERIGVYEENAWMLRATIA